MELWLPLVWKKTCTWKLGIEARSFTLITTRPHAGFWGIHNKSIHSYKRHNGSADFFDGVGMITNTSSKHPHDIAPQINSGFFPRIFNFWLHLQSSITDWRLLWITLYITIVFASTWRWCSSQVSTFYSAKHPIDLYLITIWNRGA